MVVVFLVLAVNFVSATDCVTRFIEKDAEAGVTNVRLGIACPENVILIEETLSSDECEVIDSIVEPNIDITAFNKEITAWVLGNRSIGLNVEIFYTLPYDCSVSGGSYYTEEILKQDSEAEGIIREQGAVSDGETIRIVEDGVEKFIYISPDDGVRAFSSREIVVASSEEEYNKLLEIAQKDLHKKDFFEYFVIGLLVLVALIILIVVVIVFLSTPKKFKKQ